MSMGVIYVHWIRKHAAVCLCVAIRRAASGLSTLRKVAERQNTGAIKLFQQRCQVLQTGL